VLLSMVDLVVECPQMVKIALGICTMAGTDVSRDGQPLKNMGWHDALAACLWRLLSGFLGLLAGLSLLRAAALGQLIKVDLFRSARPL